MCDMRLSNITVLHSPIVFAAILKVRLKVRINKLNLSRHYEVISGTLCTYVWIIMLSLWITLLVTFFCLDTDKICSKIKASWLGGT